MGDFNYPTIKWNGECNNKKDNEMYECIRDAYLTQNVKSPTRFRTDQNPTLDDLILTNDENLLSDIQHCNPIGKSDHETLIFELKH